MQSLSFANFEARYPPGGRPPYAQQAVVSIIYPEGQSLGED
ncbi:hypothetical protein [Methylotuvimicrobium sp. KM1]